MEATGAAGVQTPPSSSIHVEYDPVLPQHARKPTKAFLSFDEALEEYYSKVDEQRLVREAQHAKKKVEKVRQNHSKLINSLAAVQQKLERQATLLEIHAEQVDKVCLVINSALDHMTWDEVAEMVQKETDRGNPLASLVSGLRLDRNHILVKLTNPYSDSESESDSDSSDDEAVGGRGTKPTKKNTKFIDIELDLSLSAYANAGKLFTHKKVAQEKESKTLAHSAKVLKSVEEMSLKNLEKQKLSRSLALSRKIYWFEKFNWFITSEGLLVLSGKNAQQNEALVKRYLRTSDIYVHADLSGASLCVVRAKNDKPVSPLAIQEAGIAVVCRSSAWTNVVVASAWWVHAHQVSKNAPFGEVLPAGSFMIQGKKNLLPPMALEMGFSVLFCLDDSSLAQHQGDWKERDYDDIQSMSYNEAVDCYGLDEPESDQLAAVGDAGEGIQEAGTDEDENEAYDEEADVERTVLEKRRDKPPPSEWLFEACRRHLLEQMLPSSTAHASQLYSQILTLIGDAARDDHLDQATELQPKFFDLLGEGGVEFMTEIILNLPALLSLAPLPLEHGSYEHNHKPDELVVLDKVEDSEDDSVAQILDSATRNQNLMSNKKGLEPSSSTLAGGKSKQMKKLDKKKARRYAEQDDEDRELAMQVIGHGKDKKKQAADELTMQKDAKKLKSRFDKGGITGIPTDQKASWSDLLALVSEPVQQALSDLIQEGLMKEGDIDQLEMRSLASFPPRHGLDIVLKFRDAKNLKQKNKSTCLAGIMTAYSKNLDKKPSIAVATGLATSDQRVKKVEGAGQVADEGGDDEEQAQCTDDTEKLTGNPLSGDLCLFAVPVCAPYISLKNYKFKIKLTPGTIKRGKAARQAVELFAHSKLCSSAELVLLNGLNDAEVSVVFMNEVKLQMPGLQQQKKHLKNQRKKGLRER